MNTPQHIQRFLRNIAHFPQHTPSVPRASVWHLFLYSLEPYDMPTINQAVTKNANNFFSQETSSSFSGKWEDAASNVPHKKRANNVPSKHKQNKNKHTNAILRKTSVKAGANILINKTLFIYYMIKYLARKLQVVLLPVQRYGRLSLAGWYLRKERDGRYGTEREGDGMEGQNE